MLWWFDITLPCHKKLYWILEKRFLASLYLLLVDDKNDPQLNSDVQFLFPDINECLRSPCKNGAECVNVPGSYRCDCKSGYEGRNCEKGQEKTLLFT